MRNDRLRTIARLAGAALLTVVAATPASTQGDLSADSPLAGDSPLVDLLLSQDWTRAEVAERLLQALEVAAFQPDECIPGEEMFSDVPASSQFCKWVEELVRRGLTAGCDDGIYCPNDPVNRQQMAVFLVRAIEAAVEEAPEGPPGPAGPQGPPGPPGPAGPPGELEDGAVVASKLGPVEFVQVDLIVPPGTNELAVANCPAGSRLLNGGGGFTSGGSFDIRILESRPLTNGWQILFRNSTGLDFAARVFATCLSE